MDVIGTVDTAVALDPPRAGVRMVEPTNTETRASRSAWSREQRMRFQKSKKKGKIVVRFGVALEFDPAFCTLFSLLLGDIPYKVAV